MIDLRRLALISSTIISICGPALAIDKDESRLLMAEDTTAQTPAAAPAPAVTPPPAPAATTTPDTSSPSVLPNLDAPTEGLDGMSGMDDPSLEDPSAPDGATGDDGGFGEGLSLGEIPDVKTVELTSDTARRALDTYILLKQKYGEADFESYENLQDFVDKNEQGKAFEADIKAAGFASVDEWNVAITTLGFAYTGVIDDPTGDIKLQIEDIQADTSIAQDMKDKMIASLNAMIPSENNRKIAEEMMKDPALVDKLKVLDAAEGE